VNGTSAGQSISHLMFPQWQRALSVRSDPVVGSIIGHISIAVGNQMFRVPWHPNRASLAVILGQLRAGLFTAKSTLRLSSLQSFGHA
jgi:hypothetical protein